MVKVIVFAVAVGLGLSFFRERARGERTATATPPAGTAADGVGSAPRRGPGWLPDGPWFLVALALVGLAFLGFGLAETLPVDERGRPVGVAAAAGAVIALGLAVRRPRDGFLGRWRATTATVAVIAAVAALTVELAGLGNGAAFLVLLLTGLGGVMTLAVIAIGFVRRTTRVDALVAAALVAVSVSIVASVDLSSLRFESPAGERMADEADALRADASVAEEHPGAPSPLVLVGTGRRLVAWERPSFSIGPDIRLLVHDPDGLLDVPPSPDEMLPGGVRECDRITGPWWDCSYG